MSKQIKYIFFLSNFILFTFISFDNKSYFDNSLFIIIFLNSVFILFSNLSLFLTNASLRTFTKLTDYSRFIQKINRKFSFFYLHLDIYIIKTDKMEKTCSKSYSSHLFRRGHSIRNVSKFFLYWQAFLFYLLTPLPRQPQ